MRTWRALPILPLLLAAGCGATPGPAAVPPPGAPPHTASNLPDGGASSGYDVPFRVLPPLRAPGSGRFRAPSDARPSWLPTLPETIERYPVPEEWSADRLAASRLSGTVFTRAPATPQTAPLSPRERER